MREWFKVYGGTFWFVAIVMMTIALVLYAVLVSLPEQAKITRYDICLATERFSAAECEYIANVLYVDMWRGS